MNNLFKIIFFFLLLFLSIFAFWAFSDAPINQAHQLKETSLNYTQKTDTRPKQSKKISWRILAAQTGFNFFEVQKAYYRDWEGRQNNYREKKEYKHFKKWEFYWQGMVDDKGFFRYEESIRANRAIASRRRSSQSNGNWSFVGTTDVPGSGNGSGIGRIDCIAFHPSDSSIFWVGATSGGLWKTADDGNSWSTVTDGLDIIGISQIVIDTINPNTMYIATGDYFSWYTNNQSAGIYKSTDGGANWVQSGLSNAGRIRRLLIHPTNSNRLFAATNIGFYKSIDAGANWSQITSVPNIYLVDAEFHPSNPAIIYLIGLDNGDLHYYKSIDEGSSFTEKTLPFSIDNYVMADLETTKADSSHLYFIGWQEPFKNDAGLYKSTDFGETWSLAASRNTPVTGANQDSLDWFIIYTSRLTVSPTDTNEIYIAGVFMGKTTDGGNNWTSLTKTGEIHVDNHVIEFHPITNRIYNTNDGGIWRAPNNGGTNWERISDGLQITQIYRMDNYQDGSVTVTASQDNGSFLLSNGNWVNPLGGDGIDCQVDQANPDIQYMSWQESHIYRVENAVPTLIASKELMGTDAPWWSVVQVHPVLTNQVYTYFEDLLMSKDRGNTWTNLTNGALGNGIQHWVRVMDTYIYVGNAGGIHRSTDNGQTWNTFTLPSGGIANLVIDEQNPLHIIAVNGIGIFDSNDGGATWTNISGSLSGTPIQSIDYQENNGGIYVASWNGLFYRDNSMNDWIIFDNNLPNTRVDAINIIPCTGKIRAATLGRGVWESDLYDYNANEVCCSPTAPQLSLAVCNQLILKATNIPTQGSYQINWYLNDQLIPNENKDSLIANTGGNYRARYLNNTCNSVMSEVITVQPLIVSDSVSLDLDGNDDYINIPHSESLNLENDFTWEFWAKGNSNFTGTKYLIRKVGAYGIDIKDGTNLLFVTWGDDVIFTGGFLNDDQWHHYALVANGGIEKTLYRDGVLIETITANYTTNQSANPLYIGFTSNPLGFSIDEFKIWSTVRTETQILDNRFCQPSCAPTELALYLSFEEGTANANNSTINSVFDFSYNGNNGSLLNFGLDSTTSNFVNVNHKVDAIISGPKEVCGESSSIFSTPKVSDATYSWTLPKGWIGTSTTNSITVTSGNTGGMILVNITIGCAILRDTFHVQIVPCSVGLNLAESDDYVQINDANSLDLGNDFTFEFWAKVDGNIGYKHLLRKVGAYGIDVNGTNLLFVTWGDDIWFNNALLLDDVWHHYAFTASGGNEKKFYRDGALIETNNATYITNQSVEPLHIGFSSIPLGFSIDEFRIWNTARPLDSLNKYQYCGFTPESSNLVLAYDFEEGIPNMDNTGITQITDNSGNNNHGTPMNMTLMGTTSNYIAAITSGKDDDQDGIPNACDICQGNDATGDTNNNGICDDLDPVVNENACPPDSTITANPTDGVTIQVGQTISTSNTVLIPSNTTVTFKAGKSITLNPGFHAQGIFTAQIEGCSENTLIENEIVELRQVPFLEVPQTEQNESLQILIVPNPVQNRAKIYYKLIETTTMKLTIYNLQGQQVGQLYSGQKVGKEWQNVNFQVEDLPSGLYLVVLQTPKAIKTEKMMLMNRNF